MLLGERDVLQAMQAQHDATIATHVETERNAATRRSLDIAYERAEVCCTIETFGIQHA
jgi:hypothetical protein